MNPEIKEEYPVIMGDGSENTGLIKHWAEDEEGNRYTVIQNETGAEYVEPIDIYPCPFTYKIGNKIEPESTEE